ncbi:hypothetical protein Tdes44962_MAKER03068 [Teratosphaeria destructans]|uniref:Uncharacterized protein n=1 Tax=Teratosphaeria destructans TaxID=418781 RepID=A0A9W7SR53_9PEZI|nr:hypothetical protein Tdes44962_MAKER03068 [Teratosphaeria destructans]
MSEDHKPKAKHVHFGGTTFIPPPVDSTSRPTRPRTSRRHSDREREPREQRAESRRSQSSELPRRDKYAVPPKSTTRYLYVLHDGRRYELVR